MVDYEREIIRLHQQFEKIYSKDSPAPQPIKATYRRVNKKLKYILNKER